MEQKRDSTLALAQVGLSGFLYGCLGYFGVSLLNSGFSLNAMLFWRFLFSGLFLFTVVTLRRELLRPNLAQLKQFVLWSLFYCGCSGFYFLAATYVGTGLAMVVFFTFPAFVILISWLKSERSLSFFTLANLAALIVGIGLLQGASDQMHFDLFGMSVGCLAALCYALFIVETANKSRGLGPLNIALYVSWGASLFFLILALLRHEFMFPADWAQTKSILGISLLATALPMLLLLLGLSGMDKGRAAVLSVLEPVVTVLMGYMFLGELLSSTQALGIAVVLAAAICIQFE